MLSRASLPCRPSCHLCQHSPQPPALGQPPSPLDSFPHPPFRVHQRWPPRGRPPYPSSQLLIALKTSIRPHFRELLKTISLKAESNDALVPPPSCIVTDGLVTFAFDVAEELGLPILSYNVPCPRYLWTCLCLPELIENGQLPFQGKSLYFTSYFIHLYIYERPP
ncbi:unnamed protein product [Prunus armeniaca]|uniref:Uncharacterized protein n=1 Tax=Prunus armeniaca TaxID=36596 RepID=A0A6J5UFC5_PRUAR|nr:unnamed protein product [Prunus armeniaca]